MAAKTSVKKPTADAHTRVVVSPPGAATSKRKAAIRVARLIRDRGRTMVTIAATATAKNTAASRSRGSEGMAFELIRGPRGDGLRLLVLARGRSRAGPQRDRKSVV